MTNTRPTLRPTAASFSPATLSPTPLSSVSDPPLLDEGPYVLECKIEVHSQCLRDVRHIGGSPTFQIPEDRRPRFRNGPRLHDDNTSLSQFVHVRFDRSLEELGA